MGLSGMEGVIVVWQLDTGKTRYKPSLGSPLLSFVDSLDSSISCVIAERLSEEEIAGLREMFKAVDTKNRGVITFVEHDMADSFLEEIVLEVDNNDGQIDYAEFVAMMQGSNAGLGWQTMELWKAV
ncbi:hypothetical protein ABZP36_032054 [Zizania latifolia]